MITMSVAVLMTRIDKEILYEGNIPYLSLIIEVWCILLRELDYKMKYLNTMVMINVDSSFVWEIMLNFLLILVASSQILVASLAVLHNHSQSLLLRRELNYSSFMTRRYTQFGLAKRVRERQRIVLTLVCWVYLDILYSN